ncbi:MAG TPA: A24 family peptidase, partial [Mycobacteriales bacterium]|nr:A24 family peptidase [Mycobacteriales bacterium]
TCATPIRALHRVPVLSWVALHGRCADCRSAISARYPLVEAGTAVVFVLITLRIGLDWPLPAYLYLGAIGVALALIDIDVRRLPDSIVLPSYPVALVLLAAASLLGHDWSALLRGVIGLVALFGFYFLLALIYPAGMGFGDVKLAPIVGAYLGWVSYGAAVVGVFLGFLYGAVVGIAVMSLGRAGRKSKLPFGPFMLAGALTGLLVGSQLADAYRSLTLG